MQQIGVSEVELLWILGNLPSDKLETVSLLVTTLLSSHHQASKDPPRRGVTFKQPEC